jgi:uncharacterized protein (DUF2237 family)
MAWIISFFYIDESARFCICDGRWEEAVEIINKISVKNTNGTN